MTVHGHRGAVPRLVAGLLVGLLACVGPAPAVAQAPARHQVTGTVLSTDVAQRTVLVSHDAIEGVMGAMTMAFEVRDQADLEGLAPGAAVTFTLVTSAEGVHAEAITVVPDDSVELDPIVARRLRLLEALTGTPRPAPLVVGEPVPDFTLTDQTGAPVLLSQLRGQVVAVNFVYTSCALTQFCFRVTNHFASIARRFEDRLGKDFTLVTITFDPARHGRRPARVRSPLAGRPTDVAVPDGYGRRRPAGVRPVRRRLPP